MVLPHDRRGYCCRHFQPYTRLNTGRRASMSRSIVWTRRAALAVGAAGLGPLIAACGSGQQPATTGQPAAARRDVTLEWLASANATEEQIYRKILGEFQAANAPIK